MTLRVLSAAAALAAVLAAPAGAQPRPSDTGSMNYPAPLPQGNVGTTVVPGTGTATGSMQYPAPQPQGNVGNSTPPSLANGSGSNTGSMQYPAPQPQGTIGTTTVK